MVRAADRERAERALVEAERARGEKDAAVEAAAAALAAHRARMRAARAGGAGATTGAAMQREQAFAARLRDEERAWMRGLADARAAAREAARAVKAARAALGRAHASELVVEKHEERWVAARKRAADKAEDDELEENSRA